MPVVGDAYVIVRAVTTGFERDVQNALRRANLQNAGQQVSRSFSRGFGSGLQRQATGLSSAFADIRVNGRGAADAFRRLVTVGYFLGPAIAGVVGAVGSLAAGLVALVAQIGAAVPALAALGGALAALGQAFAVVKVGLSGIGEALKARSKDAKGAGRDNEAALRRIEDAERSLARVIEQNRESFIRSARELADAEDNLARAREEAAENLQQLNFDAEDAALSEKKATIELEKARERLLRVQDLPPNSRARREAELAFAEADLNLRRAKDRNSDLAKEQDKANKKGVEGSDEVVEATRRVQDAREQQAKTERDGLRAQTDAERALARAREDAAKGGGGAAGDDAFNKLIPEAQAFVDLLLKIKDQFKAIREEVQREFLPRLGEALSLLVDSYFPALERLLPATGKALGETAKKFAEIATSQQALRSFEAVGETNIYVIERMGTVAGNLYTALLGILEAAGPLTKRFSDWVVTLSEGWAAAFTTNEQVEKMTGIFNYAGDVAAQLGDIFGNIWDALMNIGRAAAGPGSAGEMLLTSFENATKKFADFTARIEADGSLEEYFKRVVPNVEAIGRLFNEIVMAFLRLGDEEGVAGFADGLTGAFQKISDALGELLQGAPALGEFLGKFAEFMLLFAESDSIQNFFSVLNFALDVAIKFFSNDLIMKIFLSTTAFLGFVKALTLLKNIGKATLTILVGYGQKFGDLLRLIPGVSGAMGTLTSAFRNAGVAYTMTGGGMTGMSAAFTTIITMAGPILAVVAAVAALVAIFILAWQNSEKFRDAVMGLVAAVKDALGEAFGRIMEEIKKFLPQIESISDIFRIIGDVLAVTVVPLLKVVLVEAIKMAADKIVGFIRVVGGISQIFKAVWDVIKGFFALLTGDTAKAKALFERAFINLVKGLKNIFSGITNILFAPFKAAFNLIARGWNNSIGKLSWSVPRWVPIIGGNSISAPKLPYLAKGGTVFPSVGGTLVKVAEAGKPERIEPLDEDGLSKRDKAIISLLSGGKGGQTFNIYPSQGMDERELAAMVSRQLAFQLRAGSV
jgi:phage-related protein